MNIRAARRTRSYRTNYTAVFVMLLVAVAAIAVPLFSVDSSPGASSARDKAGQGMAPNLIADSKFGFPSLAPLVETVEVLAADCATPKTSFAHGETVCAKTDGVDLSVPGNHYMNWVDSQANSTNGGTITQNPQFFLFVPPSVDTWKATVGRLVPPDSSIISNPPEFVVSDSPGVSTFTGDCATPKTVFVLGETVCAIARGGTAQPRRLVWIGPGGNARQVDDIDADPDSITFTIPTDQTTTLGNETLDNRGTWKVNMISRRGSAVATTQFVVTDPQDPAADVLVNKFAEKDPVNAGDSSTFLIFVYNAGPDTAQNIELTDVVPANVTVTAIVQTSGPSFSCNTPPVAASGTITCTAPSLGRGESAQFEFAYQVSAGAQPGSQISNTASVSSSTEDPSQTNNSATVTVTVGAAGGGGTGTCTVACPDDITTPANTTQDPNDPNSPPGAIVHFSPPSGNEECGPIFVDHCNDCFFPVGVTTVTGSAATGESCSFTVTVTQPGSGISITCPPDKFASADSSCQATVDPGQPTTSGENVTVTSSRSDGRPLTDPYPGGVTAITWTATNSSGTVSCEQSVTVNDTTPPTITAGPAKTASADENCQAAVPDFTAEATTSDNCAANSPVIVSQDPEAGTMVGLGQHTITLTATDSGGNTATATTTFTVTDNTPPAITCPDNISIPNVPGTCNASVSPGVATATDNCDGNVVPTPSRSDGRPITDPFPVGTVIITWTATDVAGNSSSCEQTVVVLDNENPQITCPDNITTSTDPGECTATVDPGTPTATDNCSNGGQPTVSGSRSDGQALNAPYPKGTTTITWTATDSDGNQASCTQTITVNDNEDPAISCPANITRSTDSGSCAATIDPGTATATDNCDSSPTVTGTRSDGQPLNAPYPQGTTTITWTATDDDANSSSCTQTVTVNDTEDPAISCPANITRSTDQGSCAATVDPGTATATDNCGSATVSGTRSDSQPLNAPYPQGTTTITWTATDGSGNDASCTQTVTVNDTEAPAISCPAPTSASADANCQAAVPDRRSEATTSDNCGAVTVAQSPAPGTMVGLGTHTITLTATDSSGNTSTCTTTFTVNDTSEPTITITSQTFTLWPPNHKYKLFNVSDFVTGASDNCDSTVNTSKVIIASAYSDESENGGGDGNTSNDIIIAADCKSIQLRAERQTGGNGRVYTITFAVTDASGNVRTATAKVRVPLSGPNGTAVDDGPNYTVNGTCPP